jgi:DNA-directed RNA polymerase subunit alpha
MADRMVIKIGDDPEIDSMLKLKIYELNLYPRPIRRLIEADVNYVGELIQLTEEALQKIQPIMGRKSINNIKETLAEMGLSLGMRVEGWPPPEMIH